MGGKVQELCGVTGRLGIVKSISVRKEKSKWKLNGSGII